jgi:hypothetical protein
MKCNETQGKWCKNKHGASKIIDTFETYQTPGTVLCGLVYALECALLVNFRVYNTTKIPVDALGTLRTTGTLFL